MDIERAKEHLHGAHGLEHGDAHEHAHAEHEQRASRAPKPRMHARGTKPPVHSHFHKPACTASDAAYGDPNVAAPSGLHEGDAGPEVAELQRLLTGLGYYHAQIGGHFGPQTKAALEKFQQESGVEATGIADPATVDSLRQAAPVNQVPQVAGPDQPPAQEEQPQLPPSSGGAAACAYGASVQGAPYAAINPYRFGEVPWPGGAHVDIHDKVRGPYPAGTQVFDCSGFVVACWKHAGVNLLAQGIGDSATICDNESFLHTISAAELQPGDLIAWHGHVGMYFGNGQVIESTPNGGVKISDAGKFTGHAGAKCKRVPG